VIEPRTCLTALATFAMTVLPSIGVLLAPAAAAPPMPPVGTEAWLDDHRHLPDPLHADPAEVARVLALAGEKTQRHLAAQYPGVVGALDGTQPRLRYAANRLVMHAAGPPYRDWEGQFLLFDPRGDGRVAQVFGDLSTATRVAVLVPGAANRARDFRTGVGGQAYRAPAMQAAQLYRSAPAGRFAVIAWLGYDTPSGVDVSSAREDLARTGAAALQRFVRGLVAVRPRATIALLGHSYGSTVIGLAASDLPPQVTDIAVFGSPGMGVDHVTQLRTTARVWAGLAGKDWVRWIPEVRLLGLGHGAKPTDAGFGARVFSTSKSAGHDEYLSPGSDSLASLVRIAGPGADTRP
jgi:hypothetical protein